MKTLICSVLLLCVSPVHARGYVVGNGGDGYEIEGNVYLRDLVEVGLEKTPLSPDVIASPVVLNNLKNLQLSLPYPLEAFARKLTEIDGRAPGIAEAIVLAMSSYRWRMVDVPIGKVEDLEGNTLGLPESARVQLAVRLDDVIRIHRPSWVRLDDSNKVALLLHEAFYSLMMPDFYKEGRELDGMNTNNIYIQSSRKTRELVGLAFDRDLRDRFLFLARAYLSVVGLGGRPLSPNLVTWNLRLENSQPNLLKEFNLPMPRPTPASVVRKFIADACRNAMALSKAFPQKVYTLVGSLDHPLLESHLTQYLSPFGHQLAVSINPLKQSTFEVKYTLVSQSGCENEFNSVLGKFVRSGLVIN